MARRRRTTVGRIGGPKGRTSATKAETAEKMIRQMIAKGPRLSMEVQRAVLARNISLRTYRTARKKVGTVGMRDSYKGRKRGRGRWYIRRKA